MTSMPSQTKERDLNPGKFLATIAQGRKVMPFQKIT